MKVLFLEVIKAFMKGIVEMSGGGWNARQCISIAGPHYLIEVTVYA